MRYHVGMPQVILSNWWALALFGLFVGVFAGIFGLGGGAVIVPLLVLALQFNQKLAQGTSLAVILSPAAAPAIYKYHQEGYVDWWFVLKVAPFMLVGSYFGAAIATWLPQAGIPAMAPRKDLAHSAELRLSLELRQITREVRDPDTATQPWVRAVALLLTGDLAAAARQLRHADPALGSAAAWEPLAMRLITRIVRLRAAEAGAEAGAPTRSFGGFFLASLAARFRSRSVRTIMWRMI